MFKNYFKSAIRFLRQNKIFAVINAVGLTIALAASFIFLLYVVNEYSYDRCHKNNKRIFRVLNYYVDYKQNSSQTPFILAPTLKKEFPQIEKFARVKYMRKFCLKTKEEFITVRDAIATDSDIFEIFTLQLVMGSSIQNLLEEKNSIVISLELSEKIFPGQNPVGKEVIGLINDKEYSFIVREIFKNVPENSTFTAQCFISNSWAIEDINKSFNITNADESWTQNSWITWILLSKNANSNILESQLQAFESKFIKENPRFHYSLQNLSSVYLGSEEVINSGMKGDIKKIKLFLAIALIILLVASINYIILSTAVSSGRAKEIGIRKTFGASNDFIKQQLLSESILFAIFISPTSLFLMWLILPFASKILQIPLSIIRSNIVTYLLVYFLLTLIVGIGSGIYTSFYLSRLKVIDVLKNIIQSGKKKSVIRSFLIVFQLIVFCFFVSSALIIRSQYQYAINRDPGYYNNNVIIIDLGSNFIGYSGFIDKIKSYPNVIMVGGTMECLPMAGTAVGMFPHSQDNNILVEMEVLPVDYNFLNTMGLRLIEGRYFSKEFGSDMTQSVILNETAAKQLGIIDPVGKQYADKTIIGILKDFNLHSIHFDIPSLYIMLTDEYIRQIAIHFEPGTLSSILPLLESDWKKAAPDSRPFSYTTIEELVKTLYSSEKDLSTIVLVFAIFTMLIAALGLFGLSIFLTRTRIKEIGIRKVFGASERSIIFSFLRGNFIIVLLSALLSIPLTIFFMNKWLNTFPYRVNINWWIFIIVFFVAAFVVLLTVFLYSYKASHNNPVNSLKYE